MFRQKWFRGGFEVRRTDKTKTFRMIQVILRGGSSPSPVSPVFPVSPAGGERPPQNNWTASRMETIQLQTLWNSALGMTRFLPHP